MDNWMDILDDEQSRPGLEDGGSSPTAPILLRNASAPPLPGMDAALDPLSEAQLRSAEARAIFEATEESGPWMDDYWTLIGEGWTWRQAVYMLWEAQPAHKRHPSTQAELATQVLGLTTDRVISLWKQENPALETRVRSLTVSAVAKARAQMLHAMIASASKADGRHSHADRKMAFEMDGIYVPRKKVDLGSIDDLERASTEDLASIAQLPEWEVIEDKADV